MLWYKVFLKDLIVFWFLEWGCKLFYFFIVVVSYEYKINLWKIEIFLSVFKNILVIVLFINFSNYYLNISNMEWYIYKCFYGYVVKVVKWVLNFFL